MRRLNACGDLEPGRVNNLSLNSRLSLVRRQPHNRFIEPLSCWHFTQPLFKLPRFATGKARPLLLTWGWGKGNHSPKGGQSRVANPLDDPQRLITAPTLDSANVALAGDLRGQYSHRQEPLPEDLPPQFLAQR